MAGTDTITIYRGEERDLVFTLDPFQNISGWTIQFTVEGVPSSPKLISKAASIIASGQFQVSLLASETDLVPGVYQYDAWCTDVGMARPLAVGPFIVLDVARIPA